MCHSCLLGDSGKSMTAGQGKPSPEPLPHFQVPESHAYLKQRNSFQQVGCLTARPQDHGKAQLWEDGGVPVPQLLFKLGILYLWLESRVLWLHHEVYNSVLMNKTVKATLVVFFEWPVLVNHISFLEYHSYSLSQGFGCCEETPWPQYL